MAYPSASERHEDTLRHGCQVTLVGCSNHPIFGLELIAYLERFGAHRPQLCDLISHPGGWYHGLAHGLAHKKFIQALEVSVSLHEPELVVLACHPSCHGGVHDPHTVERNARLLGNTLRDHFPRLETACFVPKRRVVQPGNSVAVVCIDYRNYELTYKLATGEPGFCDEAGKPYAVLAVPGDAETFVPDYSHAEEIEYQTKCVVESVDPARPGEVLVVAHLECGKRAQTRQFTPKTPESVQLTALRDGVVALKERVSPRLPNHVFRSMLSRTIGPGASRGFEVLPEERPSLY